MDNPGAMRIFVDGEPVEVSSDGSLLTGLLGADLHPTGGGCLCAAGDCPHCLVTVDGVAYVRSCQTPVREGMVVAREHLGGAHPPLIREDAIGAGATVPTRHVHCDVVVIGQGEAGVAAAEEARAAGREVVTLETAAGQEAVGIYAGPLVVARTGECTLQLHAREEVVVATGAAEIQPVAPGSELSGIVTARAAAVLAAAGIDLGRVVSLGELPIGVGVTPIDGELVRFEGENRVEAVVVMDEQGVHRRRPCDTVCLGLGYHPRDTLFRMARDIRGVRVVGDAARESDIPPCPRDGTLCPCGGVEVSDLASVWDRGFRELELIKRATLAGTGTCQGSACIPHIRSFIREHGKELQPPFTARPVTRQLTLGEIAAGSWLHPTPRTPLHDEHLRLGAQMERSGGWWRPWSYGDRGEEYRAVRERVSLGDVSTLGKFLVSGPDAEAFLEFLYPTRVATLKPGRSRYALLLDERGYVLDDGMLCRDGETRFTLSLTSAGSTFGELWIRDWAESGGYDVRILNQTASLAAINVTGPGAADLLALAGVAEPPGFLRHARAEVAGIDCHVFRLSFTGELSYELHHAAADAPTLWRRLLELGEDLGAAPHGLETLLDLRLEKGHIVVGQDTDYDSTARRIHHQWAVKLDKEDFLGLPAVRRTNRIELDKRLVGLEMELPAPIEGEVIHVGERYAGYVTSSTDSEILGRAVMLGWLHLIDGELPEDVTIDGRPARRAPTPFYDPDGERARVTIDPSTLRRPAPLPAVGAAAAGGDRFRTLECTHIVAAPAAIDAAVDAAVWPDDSLCLRLAPDEALITAEVTADAIDDPHAIVERETGFSAAWIDAAEATELLARACAWPLPDARPAFAQGAVADIPVKLWLEEERVLFVTQSAWVADLEERLT